MKKMKRSTSGRFRIPPKTPQSGLQENEIRNKNICFQDANPTGNGGRIQAQA